MMSKQRWIQLMVSGLIVVSLTRCTSQPSQPPMEVSATPRPQAPTRAAVSTVDSRAHPSPGMQPSPPVATTRQWTAVPIAPDQTITQGENHVQQYTDSTTS